MDETHIATRHFQELSNAFSINQLAPTPFYRSLGVGVGLGIGLGIGLGDERPVYQETYYFWPQNQGATESDAGSSQARQRQEISRPTHAISASATPTAAPTADQPTP